MGFDIRYEKTEKKAYEYQLPTEEKTILPFFGFSYSKDYSSTYHKHDESYTVTATGAGDYKVSKNPTYTSRDDYVSVSFHRPLVKKGERAVLENKIYDLLEKRYYSKTSINRYEFDPFKTPYLYPNIKIFYQNNFSSIASDIGIKKSTFRNKYKLLSRILFALTIAGYFAMNKVSLSGFEYFIAISFVLCIFCWIKGIEKDSKAKKESLDNHPFDSLTPSQKEKVRQKYLESLTVYSKEIDPLLKEYAILRGFDKY